MSAVDEIEAAIAKLEETKGALGEGDWTVTQHGDSATIHPEPETEVWLALHVVDRPGSRRGSTARGIVTLHRTIDAQLAILRFAAEGLYDLDEFVNLARVINGATR